MRAIDYQNTFYRGVTPKIPKYTSSGNLIDPEDILAIRNNMQK